MSRLNPCTGVFLKQHLPEFHVALSQLQASSVTSRIWERDYTVWGRGPTGIVDRLGWLDIVDRMRDQITELQKFAKQIVEERFTQIVVIGMGGSSLVSEVLWNTIGKADDYPEIIVLDSTLSTTVDSVIETIDVDNALFVVASKSGDTIETSTLFSCFLELVHQRSRSRSVGEHFVAITDRGSTLDNLAIDVGFRRVFRNPADIGGRYSALSYFGLIPASLIGVNIGTLLDRAGDMKDCCVAQIPVEDNPGAWLGAFLASMSLNGRDKLTLLISPSVECLGLWIEQLVAESTGKNGKGIIPVVGEPLVDAKYYGNDRVFVYLRLKNDDNVKLDQAFQLLQRFGHPVLKLELGDPYDIGAEFFRWMFATAVAGMLLGIHPFNQPDIGEAKSRTADILDEYKISGKILVSGSGLSLDSLLSNVDKGDYLGIMAYVPQTPQVNSLLNNLREQVTKRYGIATTLGYGPRFLHSTGQLHKGGSANGVFLQIIDQSVKDVSVPGEAYTLNMLTEAQALGDFKALAEKGRRVGTVRIHEDLLAGISKITL